MRARPTVVLIGPTPPPYHGMTTATLMLLESPLLNDHYRVLHLETADRRSQENMGRLDARNVLLALFHILRLVLILARHRPDLVYLPVSQNRWAYMRDVGFITVSRMLGARVLTHLNGGGFRDFVTTTDPLTRWLVRITSSWLHGAAVLGEDLRALYSGLVPDSRVHVIPNGIEDPFPEGIPNRSVDRPLRVTYMGTLIRSKGFMDLLHVAVRLRQDGAPVRITLAGAWNSDAEREEALELMNDLGVGEVVEFPGVVTGEAKRRLLAETDIFVLPTRYPPEGQPYSILEAMAAGAAVISTPRGAIPDMIIDGETGVLVPEGDLMALTAAIEALLRGGDERDRLGRNARQRFLQRFTEDASVGTLVETMNRVRAAR